MRFPSLFFLSNFSSLLGTESTRQKYIKLGISWQVKEDLIVTFCATPPHAPNPSERSFFASFVNRTKIDGSNWSSLIFREPMSVWAVAANLLGVFYKSLWLCYTTTCCDVKEDLGSFTISYLPSLPNPLLRYNILIYCMWLLK